MPHHLQPLFDLAHRLVESAGRLLSIPVRSVIDSIDESARLASPGDNLIVLGFLHRSPATAVVVAAASFVGFLLLVRYLQSTSRPRRDPYPLYLPPCGDLPASDIFVGVATALIGLTICWAMG
jgi:hypothetical protein